MKRWSGRLESFFVAFLVCLCASDPALGQVSQRADTADLEGTRVAVVFWEYVEGKQTPSPKAESEMTSRLIEAGIAVIDREASAEFRTRFSPQDEDKLAQNLSSFSADYILIGKSDSNPLSTGVLNTGWKSYEAEVFVKLLKADTGEVVVSLSKKATGLDLNPFGATSNAVARAVENLAPQLLTRLRESVGASGWISVFVGEFSTYRELVKFSEGLRGAVKPEVVKLRGYSQKQGRIDVKMKEADARKVAETIASAFPFISVVEVSTNVVKLSVSEGHASRIGVSLERFTNETGGKDLDWLAKAITDRIKTELANSPYMKVIDCPQSVVRSGVDLAKGVTGSCGASYVGRGAYKTGDKGGTVSFSLLEASDGKTLFSRQVRVESGKFLEGATELSRILPDLIVENVAGSGKVFEGFRWIAEARTTPGQPLEVRAVDVPDIFPSRFTAYAEGPFVNVTIVNHAEKEIRNVKLSASVKNFSELPTEKIVGTVPAGSEMKTAMSLTLSRDAVMANEENLPSQLVLKMSYVDNGAEIEESRVSSIVVFDHNTIDWSDGESVASFVTPRDGIVRQFAEEAVKRDPGGNVLTRNVRYAALIARALKAAGLKYSPDPANPFSGKILDYVQFPRETLDRLTGDCDEFSVLFASLLSSVGIEAAFVMIPGHIMPAFDAGVPEKKAHEMSFDPADYLIVDSRVFIPVEITRLGAPLSRMWRAAVGEIREASDRKYVAVREAWKKFPPAPLPSAGEMKPVTVKEDFSNIEQGLNGFEKLRDDSFNAALHDLQAGLKKTPDDIRLLNKAGVLYARAGKFQIARSYIEKGVDINRSDTKLTANLGTVFMFQGDEGKAGELYRKAIELSEKCAEMCLNMAILKIIEGKPDEARAEFVRALDLGGGGLLVSAGLLPGDSEGILYADDKETRPQEDKAQVQERQLKAILEEALEEYGRTAAKPVQPSVQFHPSGGRRGAGPGDGDLKSFLLWLE